MVGGQARGLSLTLQLLALSLALILALKHLCIQVGTSVPAGPRTHDKSA